ncbi:MAG TPA: hypothetical protein ENN44_06185 [Methanoculleus sp.]|nr:hypothetical protein [Methanoculleus sp.]
MAPTKSMHMKETQDAYIEQAWARVDEIRLMQHDVEEKLKTAPDVIKEDLAACNVNIKMFINLAEVEVDMVEHADENQWIEMRPRADSSIGDAQRELERAHEILNNPYAYLRSPDNFPRKGID